MPDYVSSGSLESNPVEVNDTNNWNTDNDFNDYNQKSNITIENNSVKLMLQSESANYMDKAIHQWLAHGQTVDDNIGEYDGIITGNPSWQSGSWIDGYALNFSGNEWVEVGDLGTFGSSLNTDMGFSATFADVSANSSDGIFRLSDDQGSPVFNISIDGDGQNLDFAIRDAGGNLIHVTTTNFNINSGGPHRIHWRKVGNTEQDLEIWQNGAKMVTAVSNSGSISNPSNFSHPLAFPAHNRTDSPETFKDGLNATLDNVIVFNDSLTVGELENEYNDQPWS